MSLLKCFDSYMLIFRKPLSLPHCLQSLLHSFQSITNPSLKPSPEKLCTLLLPPSDEIRATEVNTVLATIPETFDARTKWPKCKSIKLIRNQANCRSCWAFGAAEVISDRICIATKGARQPIISPMDMVDCCGKYCGYGCDGTSAYYVGMTVSAIQTEIMTNGPVVGVFTMYEDMYKYKSGVYRHTAGRLLGGHAIKIIGWGTQNGIPYWLIANSWGTKWGENGFFKIRRGVNECGIENNVVAGKADVDTL
ncbi:Protein CBG17829 [Caenorhabditis briggsae]|uniref:Protein CBG17829 n=1 Tax=Caenorhabditis briggsae TaxID=6238 RepID=A8XRV5_CAEBR|nr:Protein CBG17829 [Caenorhabditis briggsae]CAP35381.2 Protein CBG17829 [Caenorhabditis briggsae]